MNPSDLFRLLLPEAVLLATAFLMLALVAVPALREGNPAWSRLLALTGIIGAALMLLIPLAFGAAGTGSANVLMRPDSLADVGRLWIYLLAMPGLILPGKRSERHGFEQLALYLFAVMGLSLAVCADHFLMLFVALELAALSIYLLAAWPRTREAAAAGIRFFLFGAVASAFFLYGCSLIYGAVPDLTFPAVFEHLSLGQLPDFAVLGVLMVLLALVFKLAAAPLHGWAPEVYEKAPARVVVLIAGASKVTATLVLARLCLFAFPQLAGSAAWGSMKPGWSLWFAALAVVSMLWGNMLALGQRSVRRLLAASAIANAGYALVGFAAGGPLAITMAVFHMIVYALATTGALVIVDRIRQTQGSDDLDAFRGLARRSPWQAAGMVVCFGSLAGLPPMAGFFGKFQLFATALADGGNDLLWLVGVGVAMSAISLYYYLRVLRRVFEGGEGESEKAVSEDGLPHAALWPVTAALGLGLLPPVLLGPLGLAMAKALSAIPPP